MMALIIATIPGQNRQCLTIFVVVVVIAVAVAVAVVVIVDCLQYAVM